jgi:ABC-type nitrate/sulfonate/bicarbonate transport system ATPase subunit
MSGALVLADVSMEYTSREGMRVTALAGVSLAAPSGEITCLVGPTGAGKSTVLRLLAGLDEPYAGRVTVMGESPLALRGRIGYVTQRHTLLPWLRVRDNVRLPLDIRGSEHADARAREICGSFGLEGAEDRYPYELSGGMQQRAALGRLLAMDAPVWLLDEPFAHLDERTQQRLQRLLRDVALASGVTALVVTHSIDEAVYLGDRIVVLSASPGRVLDDFAPGIPHPRGRLDPEFAATMERVRRGIVSVLGE